MNADLSPPDHPESDPELTPLPAEDPAPPPSVALGAVTPDEPAGAGLHGAGLPGGGDASAAGALASDLELHPFRFADLAIALLLVGLCVFLHLRNLGSYGIHEPWEPKYASAVLEMAERDDLITPYYRGKERWTKPILIYWAMYGSMSIWGNTEFAMRLPSALGGVLGSLLVFFLVRRFHGRAVGLIAGLVLATMPLYYFFEARQVQPDMLLVASLTGAMTCFALGRFGGGRRVHFALFGFFVGLGFLAKGPLAGAITLGSLLLYWCVEIDPGVFLRPRQWRAAVATFFSRHHLWIVIAAFLVTAATWYVPVLLKHGWAFVDRFVVSENLHRFEEPVRGHDGAVIYYLRTTLYGMYPWCCFVPFGLAAIGAGGRAMSEAMRLRCYYACWLLAPFIIFTTAGTKIDHYILPATPALAIVATMVWQDYLSARGGRLARLALMASIPLVFLCVRDFWQVDDDGDFENIDQVYDIILPERGVEDERAEMLVSSIQLFVGAWCLAALLAAWRLRSPVAAFLLLAVAYGHAVYQAQELYPLEGEARSQRLVYENFMSRATPESRLIVFDRELVSLRYYLGDRYEQYPNRELTRMIPEIDPDTDFYVIVNERIAPVTKALLERHTGDSWGVLGGATSSAVLVGRRQLAKVTATAQTAPVLHGDDAADDACIWVNPEDPGRSAIIVTDKRGGLAVHDLTGKRIHLLEDSRVNNVDLRADFPLGDELVTLVAAGNRSEKNVSCYRLDPVTRQLSRIGETEDLGYEPVGTCLYRSAVSNRFYVFVTNYDGLIEQFELQATEEGRVAAKRVRTFRVYVPTEEERERKYYSVAEGCVADDERGLFYLAEEDKALWVYHAEPGRDDDWRRKIADVGDDQTLRPDIEGLALYLEPGGKGYLIVANQGRDEFAVFERQGDNAYVGSFEIVRGKVDEVTHTDGIDVTSANLGAAFPRGLFVAQDDRNRGGNQNFKLVDWRQIAEGLGIDGDESEDSDGDGGDGDDGDGDSDGGDGDDEQEQK